MPGAPENLLYHPVLNHRSERSGGTQNIHHGGARSGGTSWFHGGAAVVAIDSVNGGRT